MLRIRLFAGLIMVFLALSSESRAQVTQGWVASRETVEKLAGSRPEFNYYEEKVPAYTLPELLPSTGKKPMNSKTWMKSRRPELLELFRTNVYGRIPSTKYEMDFKTVHEDKEALNGRATLRQVEITITSDGEALVIHLTLFTPNRINGPAPVFLLINNRGPENTDPTRKVRSEFWPVEEAIDRGYGMAAFFNGDVDPDKFDDFKNGIHGILDKGMRSDDSWGTLAAWAWGAQRCLDYLLTDKSVDGSRVAVVGHSRGGKTALWAGAEDERFGMVIANESGCGGSALARRRFGETVARINEAFPHWFCTNYRAYNNNEDNMPVDMHMLMALIAPRPLYIAAASDDLWGDPGGSYLSLYHSLPVYRLFEETTVLPDYVPDLNDPAVSGNVGFHIRPGEHNMKLSDWNYFMDFADGVWNRKSNTSQGNQKKQTTNE